MMAIGTSRTGLHPRAGVNPRAGLASRATAPPKHQRPDELAPTPVEPPREPAKASTKKSGKKSGKKKDKDKLDPSALRRTLHVVRPHLPRHIGLILLGLVALLADVAFRVLEPWPMKFAIDAVTSALGATMPDATPFGLDVTGTVVASALALLIIVGGRAGANYLSTVSFALVGARIATELRTRVFDHVQSLSLRYHQRASIGDTSQRLVGDMGRLQDVAVTAGLPLVGNVITLVTLLVVMALLEPSLAGIVIVAAIGYLLLSRASSPGIVSASRSTRKGEGALVGSAAEALGAIRVVQSYGLEGTVASEFAGGNEKAMKAGVKAKKLSAGLERTTDLVVGIAQAAVLLSGSLQVLRGTMTPGDLVLFVMYLKIAMKPLRDMAKYTGRIARAAASGERIADLLDEQVEIQDPPHPRPMRMSDGTVEIKGLTSRDGHGRPLFEDLDLYVPAGQHVGILGPSGGGKSTLVSYLLRLAEPDDGILRVGGYDVQTVRLADLRRHVAILPQESVLFSVSVRENIRYGRRDATDDEVEEAARRAGAHDFVMALPDGYDTVLGNRGDTLSGGQRQRLAIARAIIRRSPVVVLDEATTGLDPASKAQVNESIVELSRGRTTLSITHDAAMVQGLDRVLWIEDGAILEDGSPAVLAADPDSRYARWMLAQSTEREAGEDAAAAGAGDSPEVEAPQRPAADEAEVNAWAVLDTAPHTAPGTDAFRPHDGKETR
ncbi:ABC transporter ATP-binding protein [Brachybacterium aquaticum]|uniref:ATP-binding cassette subfamily B protein n=1 Tax=Brachybacterium aquaticum TaxID=1432564 RepID=A0A841AC57_9MICO|nr:ABC transporter ATP-binding protein [Brachybacterium aquaticum]MBB5832819.1 ATP-binding cassette subfamily B protein [Brachybacterium aquaticum]